MKIIELVQAAKAANKEAFGELTDSEAATLVAAVLAELRKAISETDEPLVLTAFGKFVPREGKEGAEGAAAGPKRFVFRLPGLKTGDTAAPRREQRAAAVAARQAAKAARATKAAKKADAGAAAGEAGAAAAARKAARAAARKGAAGKGRSARKAT